MCFFITLNGFSSGSNNSYNLKVIMTINDISAYLPIIM